MIVDRILNTTTIWVLAIIAIVFLIVEVPLIAKALKGNGSKITPIVAFGIFLVSAGIVVSATNYKAFSKIFGNIFTKVVTEENMPDVGQK